MMANNRWWPLVAGALVGAACGGGGEAAPAAAPPAGPAATPSETAPAAAQDTTQPDSAQQTAGETQLMRETFNYRGAGRDPFQSLLRTGAVRPLLEDLRVTTITYDATYPANSVATLRDTQEGKRYVVRSGDQLGRLRVVQIRENEVVVVFDEFGVERQEVLRLRGRGQEDLP